MVWQFKNVDILNKEPPHCVSVLNCANRKTYSVASTPPPKKIGSLTITEKLPT